MLKNLEATFNETQIDKSEITLKCTIPQEHKDINILTDPLRLQQVISNLLNNAYKYSHKGTIEFGYQVPDDDTIIFFIKDQGIGIPKDKIDAIFNRFERATADNVHYSEGTGLGLAISKGIVNLLNGEITVESEVGVGTNFTIKIPLIKTTEKDPTQKPEIKIQQPDKITLLIAEDNTINITYFKSLFKKYAYTIFYAENGLKAVEIYEEHPEIDIILMDIRMPIMDGVEAAKRIFKINPNAKIIAQTAHAMRDDCDKYLDMGFADYVSKPIDKDKLIEKINNLYYN